MIISAHGKLIKYKIPHLHPRDPTQIRYSEYSEFLSFFSLYRRLFAYFLSHWRTWVKLIKFEAKNVRFCTWKVKKPQCTTVFIPLDRLQVKIYAFPGKFNGCSKCVLLSWIKTQIFTQKYRSWLRFYSEFLRKNLVGGVSDLYYDRTLLLFSRPMRDKDTSALREML